MSADRAGQEPSNPSGDLPDVESRIFSGPLGAGGVGGAGGAERARSSGWKLDAFEQNALAALRMEPEKPVYSFEDVDGKPVLRYAIGRRMEPSCVVCHNEHPASTKKDWKVGDVRGVLEIVRPLDEDIARVRKGLRGTMLVVAGIVGGLVLLSAIGIVRSAAAKSAGAKA